MEKHSTDMKHIPPIVPNKPEKDGTYWFRGTVMNGRLASPGLPVVVHSNLGLCCFVNDPIGQDYDLIGFHGEFIDMQSKPWIHRKEPNF